MTAPRTRLPLALALFAGCGAAVAAADVVILKDGFVVQGHVHKETTMVFDKASGTSVRIAKADGLDMIDDGAKVTVFSTHAKQLGAISPDIKLRPDYKAYTTKFPGRKSELPLTQVTHTIKTGEFNDKWIRTLTVGTPGGAPGPLDQQITHMDPYYIYMVSATHLWRLTYRTSEWDPKLVRKLLMTHPELAEPDGKCAPLRRVALAKFMLDAGWLQFAKDEMDRLKRDLVGPMKKDEQEAHDKLAKEIDQATAELVVREAEMALAAGRYQYAAELLAVFPEKTADSKEVGRAAKVGADLKTGQERYDTARRLLGGLIDDVSGLRAVNPLLAVGGGAALATWKPNKEVTPQALDLAWAAGRVRAEVHPDSATRIETFVTLATQKERTKRPDELLATAVSGWAKGRNGATPSPEAALKLWAARETVLAYQRGATQNERNDVLGRYKRNITLGVDELAQMISLLPPAEPEDLDNRTGQPVALGKNFPGGVYRRTTGPVAGHASGIDYLVKLPPEYHHGRAYPVIVVLTHPGVDAQDVLNPLMTESEKHGYVVVAPEWTGEFKKGGWQWKGEDHVYVTAVLRDAVRRFTVDNDRVFLCGVGDGANMAMDVGISHPDLFAGVVAMGPIPKWRGFFSEAWRNAQKLPFYVVTGEMAGDSVTNMKSIFLEWMPKGFPGVMAVYKGRAVEWYAAETPTIFDWMGRKKRAAGTATLALGNNARQPWTILRDTDTRFYWLQADKVTLGTLSGAPVPATLSGDVRGNNLIDIRCNKVKHLTIWLGSDMITDWKTPIRVNINGSVPNGYKPKAVEPSLEVLLEDYHERGDRRMLFLNKLEFGNIP